MDENEVRGMIREYVRENLEIRLFDATPPKIGYGYDTPGFSIGLEVKLEGEEIYSDAVSIDLE